MPVLYEHWRPDLNECFYIGISWAQEETRPYDMEKRNPLHLNFQSQLKEKELKPEVRVQHFFDITKEKLSNLEKLMIAHWRQYVGDRLTNISPGGEGIFIEWDDKLKSLVSEGRLRYWANITEEEKTFHAQACSVAQKLRFSSMTEDELEQYSIVNSVAQKKRWENTSEETRLKHSEAVSIGQKKRWENTPEEERARFGAAHSLLMLDLWNKATEEDRIKHSNAISDGINALPQEKKLQNQQNRTAGVIVSWNSIEGQYRRNQMKREAAEGKSRRATISNDKAQSILDFVGTHKECAIFFGVSYDIAIQIRTRKTWKHLQRKEI